MEKVRAKRRSVSQRIGEKGEGIFRIWGTDNHLIPQKTERDYGIDFFCQVMKSVGSSSEEITGAVIGTQVRSITGKSRPRVLVDKTDIESALRLSVPYCLIGIDTDDQHVHHLFLDEPLLEEFYSFICSKNETMSLRLDRFEFGPEAFKTSLARACSPATQSRLKLIKVKLKITSDIPGADLKIYQTPSTGLVIVDVPWITQIFKLPADRREAAATMVFEEGKFPKSIMSQFPIKETFGPVKSLVDGPILFRGAFEEEVELYVRHQDKQKTATFALRRIGDERAYVSESGLILVISDARLDGGVHKHFMALRITASNAVSLSNSSKTLGFLELLNPGAVINEIGREGIPIEHWPDLHRIGPFVSAIEKAYKFLDLNLSEVFLTDLQDEEFGKTITLLESLIDGIEIQQIMPGFVLGPAAGTPPKNELWRRAAFRIPIVANLKKRAVETWVEGTGDVYVCEEPSVICGFRATSQESWTCLLRETRYQIGSHPEVWVSKNWPAIPLFKEKPEVTWTFGSGIEYPLEGDIRPLVDD